MLSTRQEYPRPQFRREKWQNLNGEWQFAFDDEKNGSLMGYPTGRIHLNKKINVPFTYQSEASGIGDAAQHDCVWYRRTFVTDDSLKNGNVLLCFNGCDYRADIWVNGYLAITHTGAYTAFKADITKYLTDGENTLVVRCEDPLSMTTPRGKQSYKPNGKRFACWYTPSTGIWQSVWLERFDEDCIDEYSLFADTDKKQIYGDVTVLYSVADTLKIKAEFGGKIIAEHIVSLRQNNPRTDYAVEVASPEENLRLWTPETPALYNVTFTLLRGEQVLDVCRARIGMRKISVNEQGQICLNDKPFYQRLILDQGYWAESDLTPPSAEALKQDIVLAKSMGFNGARKHQKTEDPYFNYYAEELGFVTWCEMPSAYDFCDKLVRNVAAEWAQIVSEAKNATSNICYVPFNESWGIGLMKTDKRMQAIATALYYIAKSMDQTRVVSTNDGWENLNETDVVSVHDYAYDDEEFDKKYIRADINSLAPAGRAQFVDGAKYHGQPILFTEFGGIAMRGDEKGENWGYGEGASGAEEFYTRVRNLVRGIKRCKFQGYCFTQLTDVQQEVNGILDYAHKPKFDAEILKAIFESVESNSKNGN